MAKILVVDDDPDLVGLVERPLAGAGHEVVTTMDSLDAENILSQGGFDVLLTDLEMPERSGLDLLQTGKDKDATLVVVMLTGHATVDSAVEAMKLGAFDYLKKPFPPNELVAVIEKGLRQRDLERENKHLKKALREKYHYSNLVGKSGAMQEVYRLIERVGPSESTVLILGESGTGKELVARAIHEISPRNEGRFFKINCSALTDSLLESELFGHERGAFTGAVTERKGLFEAAHGGTLFLDEVGDTSPSLQAKLLRVLQEGEIRRVGGTEDINVDVRIIAATNQDLKSRIEKNRFREDLYFRLNVVSIRLPPLRRRKDDIPLLIRHFLQEKAKERLDLPQIDDEAMVTLLSYCWPGNVRQLENAIERAVVLCENETIEVDDLPLEILEDPPRSDHPEDQAFGKVSEKPTGVEEEALISLEVLERRHIDRVLKATGGHREQAAEILGITRRTLYEKIKRFELEVPPR